MGGQPTECRYYQYRATKGRCHATSFWLLVGYNFGCVIAGDTLFDLEVDFRGQAIR